MTDPSFSAGEEGWTFAGEATTATFGSTIEAVFNTSSDSGSIQQALSGLPTTSDVYWYLDAATSCVDTDDSLNATIRMYYDDTVVWTGGCSVGEGGSGTNLSALSGSFLPPVASANLVFDVEATGRNSSFIVWLGSIEIFS